MKSGPARMQGVSIEIDLLVFQVRCGKWKITMSDKRGTCTRNTRLTRHKICDLIDRKCLVIFLRMFSFECPYQHPPWSPVSIGKPALEIHHSTIYFCGWGFGWVDKARGVVYRQKKKRFFFGGTQHPLIKPSASDRLGDLVPQVRARTSPAIFTTWRF